MKLKYRKQFTGGAAGALAMATLLGVSIAGCATGAATPEQTSPSSQSSQSSQTSQSSDDAKLAALPPGMATVVKSEPPTEQREFFDLPDAARREVIAQWSNRAQLTERFTPAERVLISTMSHDESDRFFAMPAARQEDYLVKVVERDTNALRSCLTATHRRLGDAP